MLNPLFYCFWVSAKIASQRGIRDSASYSAPQEFDKCFDRHYVRNRLEVQQILPQDCIGMTPLPAPVEDVIVLQEGFGKTTHPEHSFQRVLRGNFGADLFEIKRMQAI